MSTTQTVWMVAILSAAAIMSGCFGGRDPGPAAPGLDGEYLDMVAFNAAGDLVPVPRGFLERPLVPISRDLERAAREPTLGVDPDGNVFVGVWDQENVDDFMPGNLDDDDMGRVLSVYASFDDGATWANVRPPYPLGYLVQMPPTTNDAFLHVDPVTGRLITNDYMFACSTAAISDDQGGTWIHNPVGCGLPGVDHQSITTGDPRASAPPTYPRNVYYCVALHCSASLDGGLTFGPSTPAFCPSDLPLAAGCFGGGGHVKTDADGRVMIGASRGGLPTMAISEDDAATWRTSVVNETLRVYWHDVELAGDAAGTLYAMWNARDGFPYYAVTHDLGLTWGPAVKVAPPGLTVTSFPMVVAGGAGEAAFLFMGTDHGPALLPGTHPSDRRADMKGALWNWYLTVSLDAAADEPTFVTVALNRPDDPVAADACWPGYRDCEDVGEFVDMVIGPDGRIWASVFDSCQETCKTIGGNEPRGGKRGKVLTLSEGPALDGSGTSLAPLWYADALLAGIS